MGDDDDEDEVVEFGVVGCDQGVEGGVFEIVFGYGFEMLDYKY